MNKRFNSFARQKGIATVVLVLMIGMGVTATTNEVMHSIRSSQEANVAVNAVTHAENGLWIGAEAFRQYLTTRNEFDLSALNHTLDIDMDDSYGDVSARNISVSDEMGGGYVVIADIVNVHNVARSSVAIRLVFDMTAAGSPPVVTTSSVNFNDDLSISGGIELIDGGSPVDLNVNGDVTIDGVNVNPINNIRTTGSVTIGSNVTVNSIYANDDVTLYNTTLQTVSTLGDFTANGSASVQNVWANGDALINASGRFENVNSVKNIDVRVAGYLGHGFMRAGETIFTQAGPIDTLRAVGDITLNTWSTLNNVTSMGDLQCVSPWWDKTTSLSANGLLINCPVNVVGISAQEGATEVVVPMNPLTEYEFFSPLIDVWALRSEANYFVEYDDSANRIKVTVNNVNNIADDSVFYLANYDNFQGSSYKDYLCTTISPSGQCMEPALPLVPLCIGQSVYNGCILYDTGTGTFTVSPNNTAPGVMFFKGNLKLQNGSGYTTYLVSGDISTLGSFESWSPNFGSYNKVCEADAAHVKQTQTRPRYTDEFSTQYPTNLCDTVNDSYQPTTTGNIALAAGGIDPEGTGEFSGGTITLGASTRIVGAVLAGDVLITQGDTNINGAVSASAQGDGSVENSLGAKTVIDLNSGTEDFNPTEIPEMGGDGGSDSGADQGTPGSATLRWARVL